MLLYIYNTETVEQNINYFDLEDNIKNDDEHIPTKNHSDLMKKIANSENKDENDNLIDNNEIKEVREVKEVKENKEVKNNIEKNQPEKNKNVQTKTLKQKEDLSKSKKPEKTTLEQNNNIKLNKSFDEFLDEKIKKIDIKSPALENTIEIKPVEKISKYKLSYFIELIETNFSGVIKTDLKTKLTKDINLTFECKNEANMKLCIDLLSGKEQIIKKSDVVIFSLVIPIVSKNELIFLNKNNFTQNLENLWNNFEFNIGINNIDYFNIFNKKVLRNFGLLITKKNALSSKLMESKLGSLKLDKLLHFKDLNDDKNQNFVNSCSINYQIIKEKNKQLTITIVFDTELNSMIFINKELKSFNIINLIGMSEILDKNNKNLFLQSGIISDSYGVVLSGNINLSQKNERQVIDCLIYLSVISFILEKINLNKDLIKTWKKIIDLCCNVIGGYNLKPNSSLKKLQNLHNQLQIYITLLLFNCLEMTFEYTAKEIVISLKFKNSISLSSLYKTTIKALNAAKIPTPEPEIIIEKTNIVLNN